MSSSQVIHGENEAMEVPHSTDPRVGAMCIPVLPPTRTLSVLIVFMVNQAGMIHEHDLFIHSEDVAALQ